MDWEKIYNNGEVPWDAPIQKELINVVDEYFVNISSVLDIGCGTGESSIELSKRGFDVTGIDISPTAIELSKNKVGGDNVKFEVCDIFKKSLNKSYDLVIDIGCFHHNLNKHFVEIVYQSLNSNGMWFSAIGSAERRQPCFDVSLAHDIENIISLVNAPPAHDIENIISLVNPLFEIILIRTFNFGGQGFSFWSCLMCRR